MATKKTAKSKKRATAKKPARRATRPATTEPIASVAEGAAAAPISRLHMFKGHLVPVAATITELSATHWRGELLGNSFEGSPDGVATSLRKAADDAASFTKKS